MKKDVEGVRLHRCTTNFLRGIMDDLRQAGGVKKTYAGHVFYTPTYNDAIRFLIEDFLNHSGGENEGWKEIFRGETDGKNA